MIAGVVEPDSPEILNQHEVAAGRWFIQCVYEPAAVGRKGKPTGRAFFSEVGDLLNVFAVPLTTYLGSEGYPTFSPDGSQVAFQWDGGKSGAGIYVKVIGLEPPVLVAKTTHGYPAWSPDGRFIAFLGPVPSGNCGVFLVPAVGGPVRKLAEISSEEAWVAGHFVAWHPDGKWLVAVDKLTPADPYALFLVSSETGEKRRLTSPPKGIAGDQCPAFSPNGHAIVFARNTIPGGEAGLHILELTDDLKPIAEPRRLTSDLPYAADPAWTADGRSVVFTGGEYQRTFLCHLEIQFPGWRPGRIERLGFAGDGSSASAISRQGRLAFMRAQPTDTDIWRLELSGGRPIGKPAVRFISSTRLDHTPAYSPDGRRIAFASNRSGSHQIWVSDSDGGNFMQLNFHRRK